MSDLEKYPDVLNFKQVQEILHVGKNLLLDLLNSGEIPAFKVGKLWRVYKRSLILYLEQSWEKSAADIGLTSEAAVLCCNCVYVYTKLIQEKFVWQKEAPDSESGASFLSANVLSPGSYCVTYNWENLIWWLSVRKNLSVE